MSSLNKIHVDFHNADKQGRVRLYTEGSLKEELKSKNIKLEQGLQILLTDDDDKDDILLALAVVEFSAEENMWVANIIEWDTE